MASSTEGPEAEGKKRREEENADENANSRLARLSQNGPDQIFPQRLLNQQHSFASRLMPSWI